MLAMLQLLTRYHYVEQFTALPSEKIQKPQGAEEPPNADGQRGDPPVLRRRARAGPSSGRRGHPVRRETIKYITAGRVSERQNRPQ